MNRWKVGKRDWRSWALGSLLIVLFLMQLLVMPSAVQAAIATDDAAGTIRYTSSLNWNSTDFFTYTVSEGSTLFCPDTGHYYEFVKFGASDNKSWFSARDAAAGRWLYGMPRDTPSVPTATVTVNVSPVNDSPIAAPDAFTTAEDTALVVAAPGVLANDVDIDGPGLQAVRVSGPSHGTLILDASGSFRYSPAANYYGTDSFWYRAYDGTAYSNTASVSLTVTAVNDPPTGITLFGGSVSENVPIGTEVGSLTTQDPETTIGFSYSLSGEGAAVVELFNVNHLRTKAGLDFETKNTYTLHVRTTDSGGLSYERDFVITVTNVNEVPVAANDSYAPIEDVAMTVPAPGVLANDSDVDRDHLTVHLLTGPAHGTLSLQADGSLTYLSGADYWGSDAFTYEAWDGALAAAPATVTLTVVSVNDVPSFTKGADQTVLEDCSPQTVAGWATFLSAGPADEVGQTLDFIITNNNTTLFST